MDSVDFTVVGHETDLELVVSDFSLRQVNLPDENGIPGAGSPVTTTITKKVRIIDNLPPYIQLLPPPYSSPEGADENSPMLVTGALKSQFVDPGIALLDNYYSQSMIENHMGFNPGSAEAAYGFVDTQVAGDYKLIYQGIKDPSGNDAVSITDKNILGAERWVKVIDKEKPELTIYGANPLFVDVNNSNSAFRDPGAFAIDNLYFNDQNLTIIEWEDGNFTLSIQYYDENGTQTEDRTIDQIVEDAKKEKSLNKTFEMKYTILDRAGNPGSTTRQIVLINSPFDEPFIVDNAPSKNPLIVDVLVPGDSNTGFKDPGVTAYKDFGGGLEPENLTSKVNVNYYVNDKLGVIDDTVVNFSETLKSFVDVNGTEDASYRSYIKYVVQDSFGNEASQIREVRIVDRTPPVISLTAGPQGINYTSLQAGFSFEDPGYTATDNYDTSVTVTSKLVRVSTQDELDFSLVKDIGFTYLGSYEIQYQAIDKNGNQATATRTIEVVDTIAPQVALFSHSFLKGSQSLQTVNPTEYGNTPIIDASNLVPTQISSSLQSIPGWNKNESKFDSTIAVTLLSDTDLYVLVKQDGVLVDSNHPKPVVMHTDSYGRKRWRMSAFYLKDSSGNEILHDPGIYVRNDSDVNMTFTPSLTPVYSATRPSSILEYKVNYSVSQTSGEANQINAARRIFIIDTEKPTVFADPDTNSTSQIIVEASREANSSDTYTDLPNSIVKLFPPSSTNPPVYSTATLVLYADDYLDGVLTDKIMRTIKDSNGKVLGSPFVNSDPVVVSTTIGTYIKPLVLDTVYSIDYNVSDISIDIEIPPNQSDIVTRNLIVKDTKAPVIEINELNSTFLVDFLSSSNPDVNDEASVKQYMLTGLTAVDPNNYDQDLSFTAVTNAGDPKWDIQFDPAFVPGAIYPEIKNANQGYKVTITVKDQSGNESDPIERYLQVGDFTAPTLTLIGDYEIHDFLRFKSNADANITQKANLLNQGPSGTSGYAGLNTPFTDQPYDVTVNPEYNASGYGGGAHRMIIADYDFIDPGAYAEDLNAFFDVNDSYPDLDGDGIGEGHAVVRVIDRQDMVDCSQGAGLIHVYSWFKQVKDSNYTLEYWQNLMAADTYGYSTTLADPNATLETAPAKIPSVWQSDGSGDHNYTELSKSTKVNLDMTIITIEYRVKDGWENSSSIVSRKVYIYESKQYDGYAFYATPLTTASAQKFEDFYDTVGDNPFVTSERKDFDGDGVSDFWETALGTNIEDSSDTPDMSKFSTFQSLSGLSIGDLSTRLGRLNDAVSLKNVTGLGDFNATTGL